MQKMAFRALALSAALGWAGVASADNFKHLLGASALPIGGRIRIAASPQNQNIAMELDVYEFVTSPVQGTWTCEITANGTGQALTVRMISLIGSVLQQCTAPANGSCSTPPQGLGASFLFQCVVSGPGAGSPVTVGSTYGFAVARVAPFTPLDEDQSLPEETGIAARR